MAKGGTVRYGLYMHSRTPVGIFRPGIIKEHSDAGEIIRMSKRGFIQVTFLITSHCCLRKIVPVAA